MVPPEAVKWNREVFRIFRGKTDSVTNFHHVMLVLVVLLVGVLVCLPVWYSWHTPFGLVDDYGDWLVIQQFDSRQALGAWAKTTFIGDAPRFRPFFEIYNWLAWQALGPHAFSHHMARWVMLAVAFVGGLAVIYQGSWRRDDSRNWRWFYLLIFASLFLFHPNQPVARLAPQELPTVMFLALGLYAIAGVLRSPGASLADAHGGVVTLLVLAFLGMAFTKETNVALLAWFLLWQCCFHARPFRVKTALLLLGQTGVFVFVCWRVWAIRQHASYGSAPLTGTLMFTNLAWIIGDGLRLRLSVIAAAGVIFLVLLVVARSFWSLIKQDRTLDDRFMLFLLGTTAAVGVMALSSWHPVPRYLYPLVFLLAVLACWGSKVLLRILSGTKRQWVGMLFALWALFVLIAQYHNYLYQFAAQHHARQVDQLYLDELSRLTGQGESIAVGYGMKDPDLELVWQTHVYMNHFRPRFREDDSLVSMDIRDSPADHDWMVSPRKHEPGWKVVTRWGVSNRYQVLSWTQALSAVVQFRKYPYVYLDAGVHDLNYAWYLHGRVADHEEVGRKNERYRTFENR